MPGPMSTLHVCWQLTQIFRLRTSTKAPLTFTWIGFVSYYLHGLLRPFYCLNLHCYFLWEVDWIGTFHNTLIIPTQILVVLKFTPNCQSVSVRPTSYQQEHQLAIVPVTNGSCITLVLWQSGDGRTKQQREALMIWIPLFQPLSFQLNHVWKFGVRHYVWSLSLESRQKKEKKGNIQQRQIHLRGKIMGKLLLWRMKKCIVICRCRSCLLSSLLSARSRLSVLLMLFTYGYGFCYRRRQITSCI